MTKPTTSTNNGAGTPHTHEHEHAHTHADGTTHTHSHSERPAPQGGFYHSHEEGGPEHYHPDSPGKFTDREDFQTRDFQDRSFTIGIGGPVGSGKTALVLSLCKYLRDKYSLVVVTNDIFTKEDCEFLVRNKALDDGRVAAVETGGCPHAAVREDCSININALEELCLKFKPDLALVEAGGDNLAANFSRELADYIIYVIDVAGGDKIPRKGGPGITQSDLLVVNKTDLAEAVGADLELMRVQANQMREGGPVQFAQVKHMKGVPEIAERILKSWVKLDPAAKSHPTVVKEGVVAADPTTTTTTTATSTSSGSAGEKRPAETPAEATGEKVKKAKTN